jgi:hypothetical protein
MKRGAADPPVIAWRRLRQGRAGRVDVLEGGEPDGRHAGEWVTFSPVHQLAQHGGIVDRRRRA